MRSWQRRQLNQEQGFTLIEIIVATAIFVTVVTAVLALFNFVLQINRRVQAVRQVAQASRSFTEILSREIRNGRIDFTQSTGNCNVANYTSVNNQSLALTTFDGTHTCLYLTNQNSRGLLNVERRSLSGNLTTEVINPENFSLNPTTFRFIVRPTTNPSVNNKGVQPMVTVMAEFVIFPGQRDEQVIPYQTTISSDVYDVPAL